MDGSTAMRACASTAASSGPAKGRRGSTTCLDRRLTPLALAAAVAGTNLGHVVAGGGELLGGGPSLAAPAPVDQEGRHGTTIVVRGRPGLTAHAEATKRKDHPDRQRCDRRAVDEPGLTRIARDTVAGRSRSTKHRHGSRRPRDPVLHSSSRRGPVRDLAISPSRRPSAPRRGEGPPPTVLEQEHREGTAFLGGHVHVAPRLRHPCCWSPSRTSQLLSTGGRKPLEGRQHRTQPRSCHAPGGHRARTSNNDGSGGRGSVPRPRARGFRRW